MRSTDPPSPRLDVPRELEEARAEAAAAKKELESFTHSAAHDLRSPLNKVSSFARLLEETAGPGLGEEAKDCLKRLLGACGQMDAVLDGLAELSRLQRQELAAQDLDVTALGRSVAAGLAAASPGRTVTFSAAPGLSVRADGRFLRVVLDVLLGNAWMATSKKERARVELGAERLGGETVFWVKDDGAGYDPARANLLFEPFTRLHDARDWRGAGLGLALARRAVERHGGRLWAHGEPGRGATFFFTLAPKPS